MSATFCRVVNGGALVTACKAVTAVSLSANNVGFGAGVTLSWSGAAGGAGNPIRGYEVYRDGVLLTTVFDGTSCTVTSPTSNGSYKYTVKALGRIPGFDAPVSTASATLTSKVSAPTAPTSVWLSATDVRIGKSVTLSWSGAAGGTNNPVAKYHVYRGGAYLTETTGTSCAVTASGTAGGKYTYTVYSIGSVSGWNSGASAGVTLTAHGAEYVDSYFTSSGTYTVPSWAERVAVTVISGGGGGAGSSGGYHAYGGGGGGSGFPYTQDSASVQASKVLTITVGAGGSAGPNHDGSISYDGTPGGTGGTSSIAWSGGTSISASGGQGGKTGNWQGSGVGGSGGAGGGGGGTGANGDSRTSSAGGKGMGTNGGAGVTGTYGVAGGGGGSYYGTNGSPGNGGAWGGGNGYGGVGISTNDYYCFRDKSTQRYSNMTGGNGGPGHGAATGGGGGYGGQIGKDASGATVTGIGYGRGGNAGGGNGSGSSGTTVVNSTAGQSGLVAIRVWRYLS